MDGLQTNEAFFEYGCTMNLCGKEVRFRRALPRSEKNRMALDLAQASLVFDEDLGVVYEGYTHDMALVVCMMRYYSELDMTEYETEESWNTLYDILESTGVLDDLYDLLIEDLDKVRRIYEKIKDAASRTFERRHSLSYRAGKALGSLLTEEDLTTTLAKAEGVNSTMIDMLGVFQQVKGKKSLLDGSVVPFAKRDKQ